MPKISVAFEVGSCWRVDFWVESRAKFGEEFFKPEFHLLLPLILLQTQVVLL
jgi:hypothetical protein